MNAKHTPGKWVAEHVGSGGTMDNPTDVYEVHNGYTRIAEHLTEDDARLIAAAPDQQEAAIELADLVGDLLARGPRSKDFSKWAADAQRALKKHAAAISKAEGK